MANLQLTAPPATAAERPKPRVLQVAGDLVSLTKPRITLLVVLTSAAGMCLAPGRLAPGALFSQAALSLIGTALIVSSANALNMWWERDLDAKMARTKNRPLPAGRLSAPAALAFGLALGAVSLPLLLEVNVATAALGLLALVLYVVVYTPMKRVTWLALLVGAVPGAMPPLMGWTTVTAHVELPGLLLFGVLFLWQVPHFAAITVFRAGDYARAGLQVIAVQRGERAAKHVIVGYTVLLVVNTLLLFPFRLAGERYLAVAAVTGAIFLALGVRGLLKKTGTPSSLKWAKQLFAYSIVYLVLLIVALLVDRVVA